MCMLVVPALPEQKSFSRKKLSRKGFEPLWFLHITVINLKLYSYQRFIGFKPVPIGPSWKTNRYHKPQSWLMALMTCHRVAYFVLGQQTPEIHETLTKPEWQPENAWFVPREFPSNLPVCLRTNYRYSGWKCLKTVWPLGDTNTTLIEVLLLLRAVEFCVLTRKISVSDIAIIE